MRKSTLITGIAMLLFGTGVHAADINVSVNLGQPGFYGRLDLLDLPRPPLIFPQPVIIAPVVGVVRSPIYLNVPPGHAKDWKKHCGKYNACGERVLFVQQGWYDDVYVPQYAKRHGKAHSADHPGGGNGNGKGKGKDKR